MRVSAAIPEVIENLISENYDDVSYLTYEVTSAGLVEKEGSKVLTLIHWAICWYIKL